MQRRADLDARVEPMRATVLESKQDHRNLQGKFPLSVVSRPKQHRPIRHSCQLRREVQAWCLREPPFRTYDAIKFVNVKKDGVSVKHPHLRRTIMRFWGARQFQVQSSLLSQTQTGFLLQRERCSGQRPADRIALRHSDAPAVARV